MSKRLRLLGIMSTARLQPDAMIRQQTEEAGRRCSRIFRLQ